MGRFGGRGGNGCDGGGSDMGVFIQPVHAKSSEENVHRLFERQKDGLK
jgi:hypothetical protein